MTVEVEMIERDGKRYVRAKAHNATGMDCYVMPEAERVELSYTRDRDGNPADWVLRFADGRRVPLYVNEATLCVAIGEPE